MLTEDMRLVVLKQWSLFYYSKYSREHELHVRLHFPGPASLVGQYRDGPKGMKPPQGICDVTEEPKPQECYNLIKGGN